MRTILLLSAAILAGSAFAEEKAAPPAPKPGYTPAAKSAFNIKGITRNPFEPIGFVPGVADAIKVDIPVVTPDMFKVSSIIVGSPGVAVINGKDFAEGEFVPVPGQQTKVQLIKVSDGQITLRHPDPKVGNQGRIVVRN